MFMSLRCCECELSLGNNTIAKIPNLQNLRIAEEWPEIRNRPKRFTDNPDSSSFIHKVPVIRATFFFNLSRNIVAVQVETLCCAYYRFDDQLVSQQNTVLQVCKILHV